MTMTQLTVVPPEPTTFRERGMAALEQHQGADLVGFLAMLHEQDVAEVVEQAVSARDSVTQIAAAAATDAAMLTSIMDSVRPILRTSMENAARAAHWTGIAEAVAALLRDAEANGTAVDPQALRRELNVPILTPAFRPSVVGFTPSNHYRIGHFRHVHRRDVMSLPFAGYAMCEDSPERPPVAHVAFLHRGAVRPTPQLYVEHGLTLEHME